MKTANIGAIGDGAASLAGYDSWQDRLAWQCCKTLENLSDGGFVFQEPEVSDLTNAETSINSLIDYTKSWYDANVQASSEGGEITPFTKSYIPELVSLAGFILTGNWGAVFVLFVKVGLEFLLDKTEKGLDPDTSTGDIEEIMKQLFGILDENGNIVANRLEGLTDLSIRINNIISEAEESALYEISS